MTNQKLRVAVIYGGKSGEHEVSLESAASVINSLDKDRYEVIPIGIDKNGHWLLNQLPEVLVDHHKSVMIKGQNTSQISVPQIQAAGGAKAFDIIFPVMHGPLYEDGALQGLLTLSEIPFVGCGVLASALSMDKSIAQQIVQMQQISVVPCFTVYHYQWPQYQANILKEITTQFAFPLFVKPTNLGSSVGTHKVKQQDELAHAISDALEFDNKVMVQPAINAREIELAVLENIDDGSSPLVSVPGEIRVTGEHEFYSYEAKYIDPQGAELLIPAKLTSQQVKMAQTIALTAFKALQCEGMARIDLFLDKDTNKFYFNEVNPIPGFTNISMYPKLWEASGISYSALLTKLIDLALARHKRTEAIKRDFKESKHLSH